MTTNIAKRLLELMVAHKLSETRLSVATGINQAIISRILHNKTQNPRIDTVKKLANYFSVTIDELIGTEELKKHNQPLHKIPFISWDLVKHFEAQKQVKTDFIYAEIQKPYHCYATEMPNQSMLPYINEKSQLIIDTAQTHRDGDFVIAYLNNEKKTMARKYIKDTAIKLVATNPHYQSYTLNDNIKIIGTIIKISTALI